MRAKASDHTKRKPLRVSGHCSKAETLAKCDWQERSVVMEMNEHNHNTVWRTLRLSLPLMDITWKTTAVAFFLNDFIRCESR